MTNILITGADGFIGSHLTEFIYKESKNEASPFFGAKIRALSQYNSFNYWGHLEDIEAVKKKDIEVLCGDIRDPHFCKNITKGVDIIFHLAALIAIPYSYIAPDSYLDTN
ncbi:MAG: GDP-mannose 4,6-dehydratase, partial [Campylobacter sp.]|uniref:GDP-mannose 4,6-dehydratase n=1 Tax=Campylobacter sp. TaxID=205 RepID=UPI002AA9393B